MNFTLEIKLTASPELLEAVKLIAGGLCTQPISLTPIAAETASAKTARAPRAAKEIAKEENTTVATKEEGSEETSSNDPITIETVRAAVQTKAQGGKRDQVKSLLTKFEVARVTDLPDTKYAKFLEEVNSL